MSFQKLLSKTLRTISIVGTSSVILQLSFINPSVAMDEEYIERSSPHIHSSFFECDFTHLTEAQQLVDLAGFLPEPTRLFFRSSAKTYDRTQFLGLLTPEGEKTFLSGFMPSFDEEPAIVPSLVVNSEDLNPEEIAALMQLMSMGSSRVDKKQLHERHLKKRYTPHIENIVHEIETRGSLNYQLFDSFFAHLLGIGKLWWVKTEEGYDIVVEKQQSYIYPREEVANLLQQLQDIGFLKNFNKANLSSVEQFYSISHQFDRFDKRNKEEIKQLVIAGGHVGIKGIESIGKCRNALTIDLSPLELPDIIANINDKELVEALVERYRGKLDCIVDTSCCGFVFDETSAPSLLQLLRPGGRLLCRNPMGSEQIQQNLVDIYVQKYGLKPVYSNDPDSFSIVAALQKQ